MLSDLGDKLFDTNAQQTKLSNELVKGIEGEQ